MSDLLCPMKAAGGLGRAGCLCDKAKCSWWVVGGDVARCAIQQIALRAEPEDEYIVSVDELVEAYARVAGKGNQ